MLFILRTKCSFCLKRFKFGLTFRLPRLSKPFSMEQFSFRFHHFRTLICIKLSQILNINLYHSKKRKKKSWSRSVKPYHRNYNNQMTASYSRLLHPDRWISTKFNMATTAMSNEGHNTCITRYALRDIYPILLNFSVIIFSIYTRSTIKTNTFLKVSWKCMARQSSFAQCEMANQHLELIICTKCNGQSALCTYSYTSKTFLAIIHLNWNIKYYSKLPKILN